MIYICYGVTKSASTYLYQLTEEIFSASGSDFCRITRRSALDTANYYDAITPDLLDRIAAAASGRPVVLKTHGDLDPEIAARIAAGAVLASASIRDPREIALSMLDHGRRAREVGQVSFAQGSSAQIPFTQVPSTQAPFARVPFAEVNAPLETLPSIDAQIAAFERWADVAGVEVFTYDQICFDTAATIARVARQIGVSVDPLKVMAPFADTGIIGQFNLGQPQRYREMDARTQAVFLERYAALYDRGAFGTGIPKPVARPVGPVRRHVANARRLLRRLTRSRDIGTIPQG